MRWHFPNSQTGDTSVIVDDPTQDFPVQIVPLDGRFLVVNVLDAIGADTTSIVGAMGVVARSFHLGVALLFFVSGAMMQRK